MKTSLRRAVVLVLISVFFVSVQGQPGEAASANPSFECWWTEPFDGFRVSPIGADYFSAETLDGSPTPLTDVKVIKVGSGFEISGKAGSIATKVKITNEPGSDGMSDYSTPYAGLLNGKWAGACVRLGAGTIPRSVVVVAKTDELNVRTSPSAKAKVVATIPPTGSVWVYPGNTSKGWLKVSARKYPPNESGNVTVVDGWVNGSFVSK
jgi:hypothetical protein